MPVPEPGKNYPGLKTDPFELGKQIDPERPVCQNGSPKWIAMVFRREEMHVIGPGGIHPRYRGAVEMERNGEYVVPTRFQDTANLPESSLFTSIRWLPNII